MISVLLAISVKINNLSQMSLLTTNIDSKVSDNIVEDMSMLAIVNFPVVVKEALDRFGHLFSNEPERRHFGEYPAGLIIAHKKNVSAISRSVHENV